MIGIFKRLVKNRIRNWIIVILTAVSLLTYSFVDNDFAIVKNLDIYYTLFREINAYYVDETDPEKLVNKSIEGMLESLDPYTVFIPENELDDYNFMTTGEYGGIGAYIRKVGNNIVISELMEGSPAEKAGIKAGDIIYEIDGEKLKNKTNTEIGNLLKGQANSEIEITIESYKSHKKFTKKLLRETININNVSYYGLTNENVGYIKLSNFTTNAHREVKNAWLALRGKGAKSLIIDLRNNPGGLLIEAIDIANLFIEKDQEIVRTKGKVKQWENIFKTKNEPIDTNVPIAILVNKNSASASEIVAGSFQDLDRAVIIGQKTYGKGLVQTTRQLSYNTKLKITTAKYYIPSGRCIQSRDYSHRDSDGEATIIADSLIHNFTTKNGRKVKDGGGVLPDIITDIESISRISLNLYSRNYLFNYATDFSIKHDSIAHPSKFKFTDTDYTDFVNYIEQSGFDYISETDDALAKLKAVIEKENLLDSSKIEFTGLEKKLQKNKQGELKKYKTEITDLLTEEIVGRYYYQKGKIEATIPSDINIKKAVEILNNKSKYTRILSNDGEGYAVRK